MEYKETLSLEQVRAFLEGSGEVRFRAHERRELYEWVTQTLRQHDYSRLKRAGKSLVRSYLVKMTGLSLPVPDTRMWVIAVRKTFVFAHRGESILFLCQP